MCSYGFFLFTFNHSIHNHNPPKTFLSQSHASWIFNIYLVTFVLHWKLVNIHQPYTQLHFALNIPFKSLQLGRVLVRLSEQFYSVCVTLQWPLLLCSQWNCVRIYLLNNSNNEMCATFSMLSNSTRPLFKKPLSTSYNKVLWIVSNFPCTLMLTLAYMCINVTAGETVVHESHTLCACNRSYIALVMLWCMQLLEFVNTLLS